jgi:L-2,4-diaminobutyrate decarboxylase
MDLPADALLAAIEDDTGAAAAGALTRLAVEYFAATRGGEGPVSTALRPEELAARFDEPLPAAGRPLDEVVARIEADILPDCNRLCHPRSLGHQVSAPLPAAVWSEALISALNQSGAVWEMSPVGTVIEARVVGWLCELAGLGPLAGGTFTSGGTEATFSALLAARSAAIPDVWRRGVGTADLAIVCGEHAHYAIARAAGEMGLGTDSLVLVPSRAYRLDVTELEQALLRLRREGRTVMAVVATAGSTATGAFDDLEAVGRLCEQHGLWLHVDAAHGGSALFSTRHRRRLAGIERAHSIAWDPHKMMLMPLSASMVLVRDERTLAAAFSQQAPYLFHRDAAGRTWDQGVRSFQCSRRLDAVKVWIALQRYGAGGIGALYDRLCSTARTLYELTAARSDFEPLHEPEANILCFRYVGDGKLPDDRCDDLNRELRKLFNQAGSGWITATVLTGRSVLRTTVMNPRTTVRDLSAVLDSLAEIGSGLAAHR